MKTVIYMIRHGESQANARNLFLGHCDMDLTETGRKQAEMTAAFLKALSPDAIYSSDLRRAYHTAKATADLLNMPILKSKKLREIDAGLWDARSFDELLGNYPDEFKRWMWDTGHACCVGGESAKQLMDRIVLELTEIAKRHAGSVVFVFTHATPIRALAAACREEPLDAMKSVPRPSNASVTKVVYNGSKFVIEEYSRDDFMGELVTFVNLPETR